MGRPGLAIRATQTICRRVHLHTSSSQSLSQSPRGDRCEPNGLKAADRILLPLRFRSDPCCQRHHLPQEGWALSQRALLRKHPTHAAW